MCAIDEMCVNDRCKIELDECGCLRRCFITGEYCSKQTAIQKERKSLYNPQMNEDNKEEEQKKEMEITAFVITTFSNMSDVLYEWRLKPLVESLKKYLHIEILKETKEKRLICQRGVKISASSEDVGEIFQVGKIHTIRADTAPVSNYVMCSRVCQQMQLADLIVVDVSWQNPNVFYEFGMAIAMGKMILPICFSESFYKRLPDIKVIYQLKNTNRIKDYIGYYPWRKQLFEFYGLFYKSESKDGNKKEIELTNYLLWQEIEDAYKEIRKKDISKEDLKYFDEIMSDHKYFEFPYSDKTTTECERSVGQMIYECLSEGYNKLSYDNNTMLVYNMEGFLNEEQAGVCIVNFYNIITAAFKQEKCFSGDRVGVLVQENYIPEYDKDTNQKVNLHYDIGEIIHIGVNQATYAATIEKVYPSDYLNIFKNLEEQIRETERETRSVLKNDTYVLVNEEQKEVMKSFIKNCIRNKGMLIYPNYPVYVSRMKEGLQKELLNETGYKFLCFFHIMLRNLTFTNEVVVDIGTNNLQGLFWLGAAHGSDTYAITVRHEATAQERYDINGTFDKKERNIFDVSGLWTAIFRSDDTKGFYRYLALAQKGIERYEKLIPGNLDFQSDDIVKIPQVWEKNFSGKLEDMNKDRQKLWKSVLESYYRKIFWRQLLRYNRLKLYVSYTNSPNRDDGVNDVRMLSGKWDIESVSILTNYLSKRNVIGEYSIELLEKDGNKTKSDSEGLSSNFMCIGANVTPLGKKIEVDINEKIGAPNDAYGKNFNVIHETVEISCKTYCLDYVDYSDCTYDIACDNLECKKGKYCSQGIYKGFKNLRKNEYLYTQYHHENCKCAYAQQGNISMKVIQSETKNIDSGQCTLAGSREHLELAQLILWRKDDESSDKSEYRVVLGGSSGPATYGLSTILVDRANKEKIFRSSELDKGMFLLYDLQAQIREQFNYILVIKIREKLKGILNKDKKTDISLDEEKKEEQRRNCYSRLVEYSVSMYLSTVLYKYFLPFLSRKEIHQITNGIRIYLSSATSMNIIPFSKNDSEYISTAFSERINGECISKIIDEIPKILEDTLLDFCGIEALFKVKVGSSDDNIDTASKDKRKVESIEALRLGDIFDNESGEKKYPEEDNRMYVNCLFKK